MRRITIFMSLVTLFGISLSSCSNDDPFSPFDNNGSSYPTHGEINGHEYVDLGLPSGLRWATCNIDVSTPDQYGDYFAWGETTTKTSYPSGNCKTWGRDLDDISGDNTYDVVTSKWGGDWRMPTNAEWKELIDNCSWSWTQKDGSNGYLITGPNDNQIFLPASGYSSGTNLVNSASEGRYWSSTPHGSTYADFLKISNTQYVLESEKRSFGFNVRAVSGTLKLAHALQSLSISSDGKVITLSWDKIDGATYNVYHSTDNKEFIKVANNSSSPTYTDNSPCIGTHYYKITIILKGRESGFSPSVSHKIVTNIGGVVNGHYYVDLGLPSGLKWAYENVYAKSAHYAGDSSLFGWGEIKADNWAGYDIKKDLTEISGNPKYDAARANWGGTWRMPTYLEMKELRENCSWTWTDYGYTVTGPNGNSIFFPNGGYRNFYDMKNEYYSYGYYWTSTANASSNVYFMEAYALYFSPKGAVNLNFINIATGFHVRAVTE